MSSQKSNMAEIRAHSSRSSAQKVLFGESYKEIFNYMPTGKLPTGKIVLGRMLALCKHVKGEKSMSREEASKTVAIEITKDWISKNVYPMSERAVAKKIRQDYERFNSLRKAERCSSKRKSESWYAMATDFNDLLTIRAYDIRCKEHTHQMQMEEDFGVKMTKEDEEFYQDNCHGSYRFTCTNSVPKTWEKAKRRRLDRETSSAKKKLEFEIEKRDQQELDREEVLKALERASDMETDTDFIGEQPVMSSESIPTDRKLRSADCTNEDNTCLDFPQIPSCFPKVKVRTSRKLLNEPVIRCMVQCLSETTASTREVSKVIVNVANMIFGQDWKLPQTEDNDEGEQSVGNDDDVDNEMEESSESSEYEGENDDRSGHVGNESQKIPKEDQKKKRKQSKEDLTYVLPSRRTLLRYLEDASVLSLKYVAEQLLENEDSVITVGIDDTTKAAGHRLYDVKADHITITGKSQTKKSLTTKYIENISHSGKDGATAYSHKLKCLAVLASCTEDELKSQIDFWMSDRGSELDVLLDNLEVETGKRLKCCAHMILGVDNAIDKVFKNTEQMIGVHKLLQLSAGEKAFNSPASSIHTLGLIALAKLLSPSHAAHSISLYNDYKLWLANNEIQLNEGFKGFVSNRFGRIAELAKLYLSHKEYIKAFFDAVVDVNSNKLVLAVATFIQNDWFTTCAELYAKLGDLLVFPMMKFLGIDEKGCERNVSRNWDSAKSFLDHKLCVLKDLKASNVESDPSGLEKLEAAVLEEVIDTLERQIDAVPYFRDDDHSSVNMSKINEAPLTNLGCESEFSKFDHRVKVCGGSTSVQTHSKKNIVATNRLLVSSNFQEKSKEEKKANWTWARTSQVVKEVKELEANFIATVKATRKIAVVKKEKIKLEKSLKTIKALEMCKQHGGPVTPNCIEILEFLATQELLSEVNYLRMTSSPNIRQMRRVKVDSGYKMQKFTDEELRTSIRNAVKPTDDVQLDVNSLLNTVL